MTRTRKLLFASAILVVLFVVYLLGVYGGGRTWGEYNRQLSYAREHFTHARTTGSFEPTITHFLLGHVVGCAALLVITGGLVWFIKWMTQPPGPLDQTES